MNTPNKLTVARMIMVPFLVVFLLTGWGGEANRYIALVIFAASQMVMIILLILHFDNIAAFVILEQIFIWISLALTIISLITYIWQNRSVLSMQE